MWVKAIWVFLTVMLYLFAAVGALVLIPASFIVPGDVALGYGLGRWKEVQRVTSPDGSEDAMVTFTPGGGGAAGTSGGHDLYVLPAGGAVEDADKTDKVLTVSRCGSDCTGGLDLRWPAERLLEVHYEGATIEDFGNKAWIAGEENEYGRPILYEVNVKLVPSEGPPLVDERKN